MARENHKSKRRWLALLSASVVLFATTPALAIAATEPTNDDEVEITIEIDDVTVNETADTATFTITRRGKSNKATTVDITTSSIDATGGVDYESRSITLSIPARGKNTVTRKFKVTLIDDLVDEADETFAVTLSNPQRVSIVRDTGIGTIVDNDNAGIVTDDDDGLHVIEADDPDVFTVALASEPTADVVTTVADGTGQLTFSPTSLTFTPETWAEPQQVSVSAVPDGIDEDDPHFATIAIDAQSTDPIYDSIASSGLIATIGDIDALLVTIEGPTAGAPGQPAQFSAIVNAGGSGDITYEWTVFEEGNPVTTGDEAVFEFTPTNGGNHIVQAVVSDDQSQTPATFLLFTSLADVATSVFVEDIVWLADEGITKGCNPPDNDLFCPANDVTRGQMAAFLVRFLGLTDDGGGNTFIDDNDSIFEDDIAKLAAAGITAGCNAEGTEFCPDQQVTRGEMAAFLVRGLGLTAEAGSNVFTDASDSLFEADIAKLSAAGITAGCNADGTEFCPDGSVTRGQMAAFLNRAAGN